MQKRLFALILLSILLISTAILFGTVSNTAQAAPGLQLGRKLGGVDVAAYCSRRNQNAILVNNNTQWACANRDTGQATVTLTQNELTIACREQFGDRPGVVAVQDGTDPTPAYRWSCIENTINTNPPVPENIGQTRLSGVDVQGYCSRRGWGVQLINNGADWACSNSDGSLAVTFTQTEFDLACREQHGNRTAIVAKKDGTNSTPAFNWTCHDLSRPQVVPTFRSGGRLGGLYVAGYCIGRGLQLRLVNDGKDFACVNPFSGVVNLILTKADFDNLCRESYHSTAYAQQEPANPAAYGWACYEPTAAESYGVGSGTGFTRNFGEFGPVNGTLAAKPGYEVNVRAEPNLEAAKLGRINSQGAYPILGREGDWYRIEFNGQIGFVAARWVQVKGFTVGR
jgi:hypothetical protein